MDFQGINEAYRMFFGTAENPKVIARSTVAQHRAGREL